MIKTKDLIIALLSAAIAAAFASVVMKLTIGNPKSFKTQVEVVDKISSDFNFVGKPYFANDNETLKPPINPTKNITIDNNANNTPIK